jgi:hypothetical protein
MADTPSAIPYGTAAQGQGLFATSGTAGVWAYSAWDTTTVAGTAATYAGTAPAAPVVTAGSTPIRGNVTFGTGTAPSGGAQVTLTYGATLPAAPIVVLSGANDVTSALTLTPTSVSTTGFVVTTHTTPATSQAGTAYSVNWIASL